MSRREGSFSSEQAAKQRVREALAAPQRTPAAADPDIGEVTAWLENVVKESDKFDKTWGMEKPGREGQVARAVLVLLKTMRVLSYQHGELHQCGGGCYRCVAETSLVKALRTLGDAMPQGRRLRPPGAPAGPEGERGG